MGKEKKLIESPAIQSRPFTGNAKRIFDVYTALSKKPLAGKAEFQHIVRNPSSPEATILKDGSRHYFLGGSSGKVAHFLVWTDDHFTEGTCWMTDEWFPTEMVVLKRK